MAKKTRYQRYLQGVQGIVKSKDKKVTQPKQKSIISRLKATKKN